MWFEPPEEVKAEMERREMEAEAENEAFQSWLKTVDEETALWIYKMLTRVLAGPLGVKASASQYHGVIGGVLLTKYNICLACMKNHDIEFLEEEEIRSMREGGE